MKLSRLFGVAGFSLLMGGTAFAQSVGIATSNPGSLFHNIGSAVAKVANEGGLNATIQPATSPNQYLPLVNAGEIEFGVANLTEFNYALQGEKWFNSRKNPDLRVVGLIMPLREGIFVRKDSDIKTIADLRGKPMVAGYTAQKTILPQLDAHYATAGMTRDDVKPVQVASVVAGANAFMSGESVGFIFAHGAGKVREADAKVGGLRALPIDNTPENLALVRKHWPAGYFIKIKPGRGAPGVLEEGWFVAYAQLVFTNKGVADDTVYKMAKILHDNQKGMADVFGAFRGFKPKAHMVGDTSPAEYHPGAVKFYQEAGLWK
ncbi:MAG: TAXI family TRAP transporter solute-binding subunit [Gammaproteobacteria bacterium]|nr:TAXI family TRAP transporter solute-binding subunit [Gammaproteobacteria bacterium]